MNEKDFNMEFYILTKEETIELIKQVAIGMQMLIIAN